MFLQDRNFSKEILTIIIIPPWSQACIYWRKVCYMTASFTAIHYFYDCVIISLKHLKESTCQGNCLYFTILFATIHYNKRSAVDLRKSWRVYLFEENHCSPDVLKALMVICGWTTLTSQCPLENDHKRQQIWQIRHEKCRVVRPVFQVCLFYTS